MNKEEFYNYLSNPVLLSNITENDIDDIITEFPYFQTAYILKAKILSDKKSIKFDNQIKTTSLYALDRRLLYEYINTNYSAQNIKEDIVVEEKSEIEEEIKTIETSEKVEIETVEETKEPEIIIEKPTEEIVEEVEKTEIVIDTEITEKEIVEEKTEPKQVQKIEQVVETKEEAEIIAEEPKEIVEEIKQEETVKPVIKTRFSGKRTIADEVLDKLRDKIENRKGESIADKILREAKERKEKKKLQVSETPTNKSVSKSEPIIEKTKEPEVFKEKELETPKTKHKIYFVKINIDKLKSHQEKLEKTTEVEKIKPIAKRKIYFVKLNAEHLFTKSKQVKEKKTISENIVGNSVTIEPELEELIEQPVSSYYNIEELGEKTEKISSSSEMGFADWLNFVENRAKKPEKLSTNNLIDKFISENPSISINVEENVDIEKKEKSPDKREEGDFVTETLANIYIKQKHYDKAILAMGKLSLKYPQKNSYFANRINEIKNLIKE